MALDPYETLTDRVAGELSSLPELKTIEHRIGDPQKAGEAFSRPL